MICLARQRSNCRLVYPRDHSLVCVFFFVQYLHQLNIFLVQLVADWWIGQQVVFSWPFRNRLYYCPGSAH